MLGTSRLGTPEIPARYAAGLAILTTAFWMTISYLPRGAALRNRVERPIQFQFRQWVGKAPAISDRLKIYAFDDKAIKAMGREELSLKEWGRLLKAFAPAKPSAVFIAKTFNVPFGIEDHADFVTTVRGLGYPVIVGAFHSSIPLPYRARVPDERMLLSSELAAPRTPLKAGDFYGPDARIISAFSHIGHANYSNDNELEGVIRVDERHGLVAAPLLVAPGSPIPERFLVNFPTREDLSAKTFSIKSVLENLNAGEPIRTLPENAVIVLIPQFFSGNHDMVGTPQGMLPGGYVNVAAINGTISHRWIRSPACGWILILVTGFIGLIVGLIGRETYYWTAVSVACVVLAATALILFSWWEIEIPWLIPMLNLALSSMAISLERNRRFGQQVGRLKYAFEGLVSPSSLKVILQRPHVVPLKPLERTLSIMFVDIAQFYVQAERQSPEAVFSFLKEIHAGLIEEIHRHGGIVDKILGDGLLCYFGYRFDGSPESKNHADDALRCAIAIQKRALGRNLERRKRGEPLHSLRIGLYTAPAFIGNLGNEHKVDLTIIGHGVNHAKRLETACEDYRILFGHSTHEALSPEMRGSLHFEERYIQIKHYDTFHNVFEHEPLERDASAVQMLIRAQQEQLGVNRAAKRFEISGPAVEVKALRAPVKGRLIDFSETGLRVIVDRYLGKGAIVDLSLNTPDGVLAERLGEIGIASLRCEVRWGKPVGAGCYTLGLFLPGLTDTQRNGLVAGLNGFLLPRATHWKRAA